MSELRFSDETVRVNAITELLGDRPATVSASCVVAALSNIARGDPCSGRRRLASSFVVTTITVQKHVARQATPPPPAQFFKVRYASHGIRQQCIPLTHTECEISAIPLWLHVSESGPRPRLRQFRHASRSKGSRQDYFVVGRQYLSQVRGTLLITA